MKHQLCTWAACALLLPPVWAQTTPETLLLKDYRPKSIFNLPETRVEKARFPAIDMHAHVYYTNQAGIDQWVEVMDEVGLDKAIVLTGSTGERFNREVELFKKHPTRFQLWCGFDLTGYDQPGFGPAAVAELERCYKLGARGVGELSDKGRGLREAPGLHCDDPRLDPLFQKCAELNLPVNIHIGEDEWMYQPMDHANDGLMNAWKWRIPKEPEVLGHQEVLATLKNMLRKHTRTTFIACHFANCSADLNALGEMFDQFPNLYADMGARFAEISPIPRYVSKFFTKYQDRLLYGTDVSVHPEMYRTTFRILESADEHFYPVHFRKYHWPMHAFALTEDILKKIYRDNALKILRKD